MTYAVFICTISITMDGVSTLTQKGQVAIPKPIRDHLSLKAFDKIRFTIQNGKIIAEPVLSINAMLGIIPAKKILSKKEHKALVKKQILKKYARRPGH